MSGMYTSEVLEVIGSYKDAGGWLGGGWRGNMRCLRAGARHHACS
jgi:hypothetical protein